MNRFFSFCDSLLSHMSSSSDMVVSPAPEFAISRAALEIWLHLSANSASGEKNSCCSELTQPLQSSYNVKRTGSG
ncbi:hypothetical protein BRARA_G00387 [Brassica rapa]|uniref:Uncharacterized protein n=1 Tax=Brassica campestris TaxID=3711 RepID=A0A397YJH1_BRACM|nr:hypothetical protein BRARA_G00387 [Brassica rapa]